MSDDVAFSLAPRAFRTLLRVLERLDRLGRLLRALAYLVRENREPSFDPIERLPHGGTGTAARVSGLASARVARRFEFASYGGDLAVANDLLREENTCGRKYAVLTRDVEARGAADVCVPWLGHTMPTATPGPLD